MEMEKTPPKMPKKLWKLVRIVVYMTRESISKGKLMLELDSLTKRAKIASKAIGNLVIHHHHRRRGCGRQSALSCRSEDVLSSFVSPREYEFSCSNSPAYPYHQYSRRKYDHRFHRQAEEIHQVFDVSRSLRAEYGFPGLGNSPLVRVRQLRVTDSPFAPAPANHPGEEIHQVDRDAEKFINRFYKDLRNQRRIAAAFESPPSFHM